MPKKSVMAIHHVAIQTDDIDVALQFYVEILGAELCERRPFKSREMAWLQVGDVKLELFSKRAGESLDAWSDFYSGPVHIAFSVDDLDGFLEHALKAGASFHPSHPETFIPPVPGAGKIAYLLGPDGEEVEIREPDIEN
jgi:catechol 2,3-dioxygenase-like lactoylglutathione lyase family enzyme